MAQKIDELNGTNYIEQILLSTRLSDTHRQMIKQQTTPIEDLVLTDKDGDAMKNKVKENGQESTTFSREYETKTCTIVVNGFYANSSNEILSDKLLRLMKQDIEQIKSDD